MLHSADPNKLDKWDNPPGAQVVDRYTRDGVDYIVASFKNSPGIFYLYLA